MSHHRNALAGEPSPYLQQHAANPVAWYPWGSEALARARAENRPILLSIGYSACHWCHVMAHESFEDEATAEVMNRLFINIKVDREERPDLDKIYQTAHQLMHRRGGGWPLTAFLDPRDQMPIYTGTYFPPTARHGLPAFTQICEEVAHVYQHQPGEIAKQSASIAEVLVRIQQGAESHRGELDTEVIAAARDDLARDFDERRGGFGSAPKFPQPPVLGALLAPAKEHGGEAMALFTLRQMALGGIQDQVGGGFFRYSVDGNWMIPHFEKMLYDNAQLLPLYADAARRTDDPIYLDAAEGIVRWLQREMSAPSGGWYSALDADTEGVEGKSYVWHREQLEALLAPSDFAVAADLFRLDDEPNFEGRFHLHRHDDGATAPEIITRIRATLHQARSERTPPGLDDKVLTGWNGLLAAGLARAGRLLDRGDWIDLAAQTLDAIHRVQWQDGSLYAVQKNGKPYLVGYLDDYAFVLDAAVAMLHARWRTADLLFATALADALLARFEDPQRGGFFFTAHDHETLITRPKPFADESTPAGNGVAALALLRLGHLLGEARYLNAAERTLRAATTQLAQAAAGHCSLLLPLAELVAPPTQVVIRCALSAEASVRSRLAALEHLEAVYTIPIDVSDLPGALGAMRAIDAFTAYVCRGTTCSEPVTSPAELEAVLGDGP